MKFQKSPFPYLLTLVGIISISILSNATVNKTIEEPIKYNIENNLTSIEKGNQTLIAKSK